MNELALFAGAGGGILGGHLLGWRTVCAVEWEQYPASVLCARQNDKILPPFPIWDDVQTFDGRPWRGIVQVVSGGFPCQDISAAGKGAGIDGERSSMWKHMARIVGEVRPRYVFVENSPMLTTRGLGVVLADLSTLGFNAKWGVVSASDIGANHQRERIWIRAEQRDFFSHTKYDRNGWRKQQPKSVEETIGMANSIDKRIRSCSGRDGWEFNEKNRGWNNNKKRSGTNVEFAEIRKSSNMEKEISYTTSIGQSGSWEFIEQLRTTQDRNRKAGQLIAVCEQYEWPTEPNVGRVADGVAARVDRLKAIGNGQVPLCAATAWRILK